MMAIYAKNRPGRKPKIFLTVGNETKSVYDWAHDERVPLTADQIYLRVHRRSKDPHKTFFKTNELLLFTPIMTQEEAYQYKKEKLVKPKKYVEKPVDTSKIDEKINAFAASWSAFLE